MTTTQIDHASRFAVNEAKLHAAFALGDIRAIGGAVYDANHEYLFLTSDLAELRGKIPFSRIDSGGRPTWRLAHPLREVAK